MPPAACLRTQPRIWCWPGNTATDPEDTNAIITRWSVTGTDGGDFLINELGELRFRNAPPTIERPADSDRNNDRTW